MLATPYEPELPSELWLCIDRSPPQPGLDAEAALAGSSLPLAQICPHIQHPQELRHIKSLPEYPNTCGCVSLSHCTQVQRLL